MNIFKLLVWPFLALFELLLFVIALLLSRILPREAGKIVEFAMTKLPDPGWYLGKTK